MPVPCRCGATRSAGPGPPATAWIRRDELGEELERRRRAGRSSTRPARARSARSASRRAPGPPAGAAAATPSRSSTGSPLDASRARPSTAGGGARAARRAASASAAGSRPPRSLVHERVQVARRLGLARAAARPRATSAAARRRGSASERTCSASGRRPPAARTPGRGSARRGRATPSPIVERLRRRPVLVACAERAGLELFLRSAGRRAARRAPGRFARPGATTTWRPESGSTRSSPLSAGGPRE